MCDDTHLQYFPLTWEYLVSLLDPNRICDSFVHICISVHVNHISCWVEHICAYLCWHPPSTSLPIRPSTFLSPTWEYRAHTIWVSFRHQSIKFSSSTELNENLRTKKTLSVLHHKGQRTIFRTLRKRVTKPNKTEIDWIVQLCPRVDETPIVIWRVIGRPLWNYLWGFGIRVISSLKALGS